MPHKRAKRSIREKERAERKSDLAPTSLTSSNEDIPKSMARIINAEAIQSAYRAKKRAAEEGGDDGDGDGKKRKKRKKEEESAAARNSLKIKPGESLKHFKRRVEDDMRPMIRTAMKNTTSISKQKFKESVKDSKDSDKKGKGKSSGNDEVEEDDEDQSTSSKSKKKNTGGRRSPSPEFAQNSSSAPKRLNDIAQAPPQFSSAPRLQRLVQKAKEKKSKEVNDDENDDADGIVSAQQKRMMELEREKAINRYRSLKEAKLKDRQTSG